MLRPLVAAEAAERNANPNRVPDFELDKIQDYRCSGRSLSSPECFDVPASSERKAVLAPSKRAYGLRVDDIQATAKAFCGEAVHPGCVMPLHNS